MGSSKSVELRFLDWELKPEKTTQKAVWLEGKSSNLRELSFPQMGLICTLASSQDYNNHRNNGC